MHNAPADITSAVRQAVRETIAGTVRAWVEEIAADELRSDAVRNELRPLLVELVRQELAASLKVRRNGYRSR
jgi:1,4-alpha-glucan branching enzyme